MSLVKLKEEEVEDTGVEGLKDNGHVIIECSNCNAGLVDIWKTRPYEPHSWKVKANCPFCGNSSFTKEIKGGFHQGGMALSKEDEPDEDSAVSTVVENFEIEGDTFVFNVKKAGPNAKPIYKW
jgi:hypothetical protein